MDVCICDHTHLHCPLSRAARRRCRGVSRPGDSRHPQSAPAWGHGTWAWIQAVPHSHLPHPHWMYLQHPHLCPHSAGRASSAAWSSGATGLPCSSHLPPHPPPCCSSCQGAAHKTRKKITQDNYILLPRLSSSLPYNKYLHLKRRKRIQK